ncbi:MAG TPA: DinB family protein, partial [Puia sp.]
MKKCLLFFAVVVLFGLKPQDKTLSPQEREFAIQFMVTTRDTLLMDVKGLSKAQLNFKADSTRWSVAQCMEHIALAEAALTLAYQQGLKSPADPSKRDSVKYTDQQIIHFLTDRSRKFQAPEMLKPVGTFSSFQASLDSFVARRNRNIEFVKTTGADLRDHFVTFPGVGIVDDYQVILFMVSHSKRHTMQLEEVK